MQLQEAYLEIYIYDHTIVNMINPGPLSLSMPSWHLHSSAIKQVSLYKLWANSYYILQKKKKKVYERTFENNIFTRSRTTLLSFSSLMFGKVRQPYNYAYYQIHTLEQTTEKKKEDLNL